MCSEAVRTGNPANYRLQDSYGTFVRMGLFSAHGGIMKKKTIVVAVIVLALLNELFYQFHLPSADIHSAVLWALVLGDLLGLSKKLEGQSLLEALISVVFYALKLAGLLILLILLIIF